MSFGGKYSVCSYRFGVSKGGDKCKPPLSHPDQSARIFKVTEAEYYHVTLGYSTPLGRTEAPSSIVVVIVCVSVYI